MDRADFTSEVLTQHSGFLRALAQGILKDEQLAEDAVQDALVASLESPREATPNLVAWLLTVTRHAAIRIRRGASRRSDREAAVARRESQTSSIEDVERAEMLSRITSAVVALPDPYRSVLLARYYQGLSPAAIADRERIPLTTVKSRLARAHALIRERLDRASGGDRTQWQSGLLILLGRTSTSPPVVASYSFLLPLLAMKTKLGLALLIVALLALGFLEFRADRGSDSVANASSLDLGGASAGEPRPAEGAAAGAARVAAVDSPMVAAAPSIDHEQELRILVVATDGTPIADATVVIVHPGARQLPGLLEDDAQLDQQVAQGRSDSNGQCSFQLETRRHYDVTASAPGFARACSRSRYPGLELRMVLPRAATLVGSVTSAADGSPVAGARVQARLGVLGSLGDDGFETQTDARGHFELGDLPADAGELLVYARGFPLRSHRVGVLRAGERREMQIALVPGALVRGQVTDGSTKLPIAGATVQISSTHDVNRATTDDQGRYSLHGAIRGETTRLTAKAPGYGDFQVSATPGADGEVTRDIFLLPGRRAKGRVVNSSGAPIANADIVVSADAQPGDTYQFEQRRAQTDGLGRFEFSGLRVDLRHTLLVHVDGLASAVRDFPERESDAMELELEDIVLAPPAMIAGHVLDRAGKPVSGRWVLLDGEPSDRDAWKPAAEGGVGYKDSEGFGFGRIQARIDERGRYCFGELPGGSYRLWAGEKGFAHGAELRLDLQDGEQLLDVDLTLDTEPSIRGVIVDSLGQPVESASVHAWAPDPAKTGYTSVTYALPALDGSFELCGLEPGSYNLQCTEGFHADYGHETLAPLTLRSIAAGTQGVRISLQRAVATSLRAVGPEGQPLQGASVLRRSELFEDGWDVLGSTDVDGRFQLSLAEGSTSSLRLAPPFGSRVGYVPVLDAQGKLDPSYEIDVEDLRAASTDRVVRFERLP